MRFALWQRFFPTLNGDKMKRINIDKWLLSDSGFLQLSRQLGFRMAIGLWVDASIVAQDFFLKSEHHLIPLSAWDDAKLGPELIDVGLAFTRTEGVELKKLHDSFSWLSQKSGAGKVLTEAKLAALAKARESKKLKNPRESLKTSEGSLKGPLNGRFSDNSLNVRSDKPPKISERLQSQKITSEAVQKNSLNGAEPPLLPSLKKEEEEWERIPLPDQIRQAWEVWCETLRSFQITPSRISPHEESLLANAMRVVKFPNVMLALEGKRYEAKFPGYDPSDNLSLVRILGPDKRGQYTWDKYRNLAQKARSGQGRRMSEEEMLEQAKGRRRS